MGCSKASLQAFVIEAHQCALQRAKVKLQVLRTKIYLTGNATLNDAKIDEVISAILITESEISKIKKDAVVFYTENFPGTS